MRGEAKLRAWHPLRPPKGHCSRKTRHGPGTRAQPMHHRGYLQTGRAHGRNANEQARSMNAARAHEANIVRPMETCIPPTWQKHSPHRSPRSCQPPHLRGSPAPRKGGGVEDCSRCKAAQAGPDASSPESRHNHLSWVEELNLPTPKAARLLRTDALAGT